MCSNYLMNKSGQNGLVRVCDCHWMQPVGQPGIPKRKRFEAWGDNRNFYGGGG